MKRTMQALSALVLITGVVSCASDHEVAERNEARMNREALAAMEDDEVHTRASSHRNADDQSQGSRVDVELTRRIREKLMADDRLSVFAQNITIVTIGDTVTLKGEVRNAAESRKVSSLAREVARDKFVDNQLVLTK